MTTPTAPRNTSAFFLQAAVAFGLALITMVVGIYFMPGDPWVRAFLALGTLFLTSSSLTLAKVVRDSQEEQYVVARLDRARLDKILADHDPFTPPTV
ncbi:MAG: YiaA/YiaB family inner membrane protein [Nocardioides sp.]|uniref:YiaA/YiaB family inner membrane protein n=1 Tax=Nocardioides sp. TaxID=35761 RepID=UPI0039E64117